MIINKQTASKCQDFLNDIITEKLVQRQFFDFNWEFDFAIQMPQTFTYVWDKWSPSGPTHAVATIITQTMAEYSVIIQNNESFESQKYNLFRYF